MRRCAEHRKPMTGPDGCDECYMLSATGMTPDMKYAADADWSDDLYAGTHYDPSEYEDDTEPTESEP